MSERIKKFYDVMFKHVDLRVTVKDLCLDGYETYEDYVKYGDLFINCVNKAQTTSRKEIVLYKLSNDDSVKR